MDEFLYVNNPMKNSALIGKYDVKATFALNGKSQQVDLAGTGDSRLTDDKNIVLVFEGEYYNGYIDCPKIDSVTGTFVVNGKTYTLEKKDDILEASSPVLNYVQIKCDGLVHSFELVPVELAVASSVVSDAFGQALQNVASKGGKRSIKAYHKSGRNASRKASRTAYRKLGRKSVANKKRNRGTRKK
jgi:hypothetical protein